MPSLIRGRQPRGHQSVLLAGSIIPALLFSVSSAVAQTAPSLTLPGVQPGMTAMPPGRGPQPAPVAAPAAPAAADNGSVLTNDKPLLGAPFPSMAVQGQKPPLPLSNQPMGITTQRTGEDMQQLQQQTADRMNELRNGTGLGTPDVSPYGSELQEMAAIQRRTRLLQAKRQEAEAAIAVYGVLYDSRREEEAARKAKEVKERQEKEAKEKEEKAEQARIAALTPPPPPVPVKAVAVPSAQQPVNTQPVAAQPQAPQSAAATIQEMPLPRIVTIWGTGTSLKATLLVPYVGEISATTGTSLPGDRKVVSVSNSGVVVKDPKLGNLSLGYGDSVPAAPPVVQAAATRFPNTPLTIPQMPPMPSFAPPPNSAANPAPVR